MDLLSLAQQRFQQVAPALQRPITAETSEAVEAWLRDQVCPVTERLLPGPGFRRWAVWSPERLARGSGTPERRLVEGVDRALVAAARRTLEVARRRGLLTGLDPGHPAAPAGAPARPPALSLLEWLAGRPWFDLTCPDEYFTAERALNLTTGRADCTAELLARDDVRTPLGDYVGRAMFARVGYFAGKVGEAFRTCLTAPRHRGEGGDAARTLTEPMFAANVELDRAVAELRRACHKGNEARLRDACTALVQVYAAYGPTPATALSWLGCPPSLPSACAGIIREIIRPPGELIESLPDGGGRFRVVNRRRVRLCRPDVAHGVVGALAAVAELFRRPVEADELVEWLRPKKRLLLVDRRPRSAYWEGEPVGSQWDRNPALWDLLWKLADRARRHQPVHREELTRPGLASSAVKNRRSRLSKSLPPALDARIEDVRPGGYRLVLGPEEIGLLRLDHDEQLIEVGPEVGPGLV